MNSVHIYTQSGQSRLSVLLLSSCFNIEVYIQYFSNFLYMKENWKSQFLYVEPHFFRTSPLMNATLSSTLSICQLTELLIMTEGRSFWLTVKDIEILLWVCRNTADCFQASAFPCSNPGFGRAKVTTAIQPFLSKPLGKDIFCLPPANSVSYLTLLHPSYWHALVFGRGSSLFFPLLLSFLCSEMRARGERSTNSTWRVFPHGLIPAILLHTKREILILQGKLVVRHFCGLKLQVQETN